MLKRLALPVLLTLGMLSPVAQAAIDTAEAVNLSGMQRMLSQRIAKAYLMIGLDVRTDEAHKQLDESVARFESNYLALEEYSVGHPAQPALAKAGDIWMEYRTAVLSSPDQERAVRILQLSDQLLEQSEAVVKQIEAGAKADSAWLINRAGRQRMLSQRIAKLYMARAWNLPAVGIEEQFDSAVSQFSKALNELDNAKENTPEIKAAIAKANSQWKFSSAGFSLSSKGEFVPTVIAISTETLLGQMHSLTVAYTQLLSEKL